MKMLRVIGLMLIVLLLMACSGDDESTAEKQPTVISVYVYSPNKPIVTRGDVGSVTPIDNDNNESKISKLQIWVFETNTNNLIAYYSPESVDNLNGDNATGATYHLSVSDAFDQAATKPKVDVYVVANTESFGKVLNKSTSRDDLEATMIMKSTTNDYFGLTSLTDKVPVGGLPMSGVLRGASVSGSAPVFKIPTISLTRAVSKIRFVFSREMAETTADDIAVQINSIKLNESMIPTQEYLFLETGENANAYHVGEYGTDDAKEFLDAPLSDICKNDEPLKYIYQSQYAQDYENLIASGVTANELTQLGPYYLRESGHRLEGVIKYKKGTEDEKSVNFGMYDEGDFSRNHTWIVYAYYSTSGLVAVTVVVQDWVDGTSKTHEVYNW